MDSSDAKILNSGKMSTIQLELTRKKPKSTATKFNSTTRLVNFSKNEHDLRIMGS